VRGTIDAIRAVQKVNPGARKVDNAAMFTVYAIRILESPKIMVFKGFMFGYADLEPLHGRI